LSKNTAFEGDWGVNKDLMNVYLNECILAVDDLTNFKRGRGFSNIVGNDLRRESVARSFMNYLRVNFPELISRVDLFKANDIYGAPNIYKLYGVDISPGTLRYMKVLSDVIHFEPQSVVEIGSGYGGQALVITKWFEDAQYTLIDLQEPLSLAKHYLNQTCPGGNFVYFSTDDIDVRNYDLVISDYCLSEFDEEGVDFYVNHVIKHCKYGYFSVNVPEGKRRNYLLTRLWEVFDEVKVKDEYPKTSPHPNIAITCSGNRVLHCERD